MKQFPLSLCGKASIINAFKEGVRHDGRAFLEVRRATLHFGKDYGCCSATIGETRVLAQVTCEVVEPIPSRPNEGVISIFVHLSSMAAPYFEASRVIELSDMLQQLLERNIKHSRCLDLESLCILAEESVWQLKVDVTVLNHAGNLGDACNLASVGALLHFHRPDVSVEDDSRIVIHSFEEREPIPTFMKKVPVCLTYAFFMFEDSNKSAVVMDPTELEERVMSGKLVVGLNPHGEITSLMFPGGFPIQKEQIINCINSALLEAKKLGGMIQELVKKDLEQRSNSIKVNGFLNCLSSDACYSINKYLERVEGCSVRISKSNRPSQNIPVNMEIDDVI